MTIMNRVRTVWLGVAGAPYYTNLYFTDDTTLATANDAIGAVASMITSMNTNLKVGLTWTVEGNVARIDDTNGALVGAWGGTQATGAGTGGGEQLPRQAQGLMRILTNNVVGGRILKGRMFWPGAQETLNDTNGNPIAAYVASLTTVGNTLINDVGNELRVWSRTHGVSFPATACVGGTYWATLNSRRD